MQVIWEFFFSLSPNQAIGTAVNLVIIILGLFACYELWHAFRTIRGDSEALTQFDHQARGRTDAAQILEVGRSLPGRHLLARRIQMLQDLHAIGSDIDTAALASFAVAELDRAAGRSRWVASTVVLLGLGGTLLGLSQAVIRAQPMLGEIVSSGEAVQAVIGTFSGLSTAFSTTLMGIFWAVCLGLTLARFRRRQGEFLQRLEEVSLVRVVPHFRTSPALAMVEAAQKLTSLESRLGVALGELVSQVKTQGLALTKIVEDSISDLIVDARASGQGLRQSVDTSMQQLIRMTGERGVALATTIDSSFATLTQELHDGTTAMLDRLEATHAGMQRMLGDAGADARTLSENLQDLRVGVEALRAASEQMNQMTPAIEEAIARQVDRQSRDLHETMHAYTGRLGAAAEKQDVLVEDGFHRLEQGMEGFGEVLLGQLQEHDRSLLEQVSVQVGHVANSLESQDGTMQYLRAAIDRLAEVASELQGRGAQDAAAAAEIREASNTFVAQLDDLGGRLERLRSALESASSAMRAPVMMPAPAPVAPPQPLGRPGVPNPDGRGSGAMPPSVELPRESPAPATRPSQVTSRPQPTPPPDRKQGPFSWLFRRK